jgi:hypothetical protein
MSALVLTGHAAVRMAQRSINMKDADLIALIGTEVEGGYLVLARDCQKIETELKQFLDRIWRICGKRLVISNGRIVTAYHASKSRHRQLRRNAYESDLHARRSPTFVRKHHFVARATRSQRSDNQHRYLLANGLKTWPD